MRPDARLLDRGQPRDEDTEGGNQPADESLINRRLKLHLRPSCEIPCSLLRLGQAAILHAFILDSEHERLGPYPLGRRVGGTPIVHVLSWWTRNHQSLRGGMACHTTTLRRSTTTRGAAAPCCGSAAATAPRHARECRRSAKGRTSRDRGRAGSQVRRKPRPSHHRY